MKWIRLSAVLSLLALSSSRLYADDSKPIAKVGNTVLTEDEMRQDMAAQLYQIENSMYATQKNWVDQKAQEILFNQAAKDAKLSRKAWEEREIDKKAAPVNEAQAQQMAGRFAKPGVSSMDALQQAKEMAVIQNKNMRRYQVYQELMQKTPVEMLLTKPVAPRVNVTFSPSDPAQGDSKAPVTIVEFTDFQCPYCKRGADTMKQVEQNFAKEVRIIARQNPLPFHERGKPAAEAALCAHDQGKYWEYRDKLFDKQQLSDADFRRYAKELNLNEKKFESCLTNHKHSARVEADLADGKKFGVNGTPHFFINGQSLVGAQPYQAFEEAIKAAQAAKN